MNTEELIIKREALERAALAAHDELSEAYYSDRDGFPGGKESFDEQHGRIWTDLNDALADLEK